MFNQILDRKPEEYKGYIIRTDFRIGMQITLCLEDDELDKSERLLIAVGLLFGKGAPTDYWEMVEAIKWFLSCGSEIENKTPSNEEKERVLDYDIDAKLIYTAFKKSYGIDLTTVKLHWFDFNAMLQDLGECALTEIMKIRAKKISEATSNEERNFYVKAKAIYSLPQKGDLTPAEQSNHDEFMRRLEEGEQLGPV